jgi:hypothetical protein
LRASVYCALVKHEVTCGEISEGFRSTLNVSTLIPPPKRLAQEYSKRLRFYISAISLPIEELKVQAKERSNDEHGEIPLMVEEIATHMA